MEQSACLPTNPPETPDDGAATGSEQTPQHTVEAEDLLETLGDEYTHRVFTAVVDEPRTGSELVDATGVSRATVYRRLQELEEAGLVDSTVNIASDGNHCKRFHAVVTSLRVNFDADGFSARLEAGDRPGASATAARPPADD